jgi:hypothetical protein
MWKGGFGDHKSCLSVRLCAEELEDIHEILQGGHAIEGDVDNIVLNLLLQLF